MIIKEEIRNRIFCVVWLVILLLLSTVWWIACIVETVSKRKSKYGKANYFVITWDAYRTMYHEFVNTCKMIKTGEKFWK